MFNVTLLVRFLRGDGLRQVWVYFDSDLIGCWGVAKGGWGGGVPVMCVNSCEFGTIFVLLVCVLRFVWFLLWCRW